MTKDFYAPNVVDFAYQIIALHKENEQLHQELEHYKKLDEMHCVELTSRDEHTKDLTGIMLRAVLDPDSGLNKGYAAIVREQVLEANQPLETDGQKDGHRSA
jgi:hypothetical protein